jgi:hypothetical protein
MIVLLLPENKAPESSKGRRGGGAYRAEVAASLDLPGPRIARLPLNIPVVGAPPQAERFGDSRKGIARGDDLKGGSNVIICCLWTVVYER